MTLWSSFSLNGRKQDLMRQLENVLSPLLNKSKFFLVIQCTVLMLNTKKRLAWDSKNLHTIWTVNLSLIRRPDRPNQGLGFEDLDQICKDNIDAPDGNWLILNCCHEFKNKLCKVFLCCQQTPYVLWCYRCYRHLSFAN